MLLATSKLGVRAFPQSATQAFTISSISRRYLARKHLCSPQLYSFTSSSSPVYGIGLDQEALMESDLLVAVNQNDSIIEDARVTKRQGHAFSPLSPRAMLHRAFSFFLFDADNNMLLTQRANSKITFPNVWTNTCCSHPLQAMPQHNEVDVWPHDYPQLPGIKHATRRKLQHELGIPTDDLPAIDDIVFVTRFHYWAADCISHGLDAPWGEHEIDYILFCRTKRQPRLFPNKEEVAQYKYVSRAELKQMMSGEPENPTLLWSPWFRGIMDRGGWDWWADLEGTLQGKYTNTRITYFDPPSQHIASYNLLSHGPDTGVLTTSSTSLRS